MKRVGMGCGFLGKIFEFASGRCGRGCEVADQDRVAPESRARGRRGAYGGSGETLTGQVTATHYRVEGAKSGISVALKTTG